MEPPRSSPAAPFPETMAVVDLFLCHYDRKDRWLQVFGSTLLATLPVFGLLNYFSLNDREGYQNQIKPKDHIPALKIFISRAFRNKKIDPPKDVNWDSLMTANTLQPNRRGSPRHFIRKQQDEREADRLLFLLCEKLDIEIYHGWIESPQDPNDVGQRGLTRHGLESLTNEIGDEKLSLVFRNGCIDVGLKHHGSLLLLETDSGTKRNHKNLMWRMLTVCESDEIFFESSFSPLDLSSQPNAQEAAVVQFITQLNKMKEKASLDYIDELTKEEREKDKKVSIKMKTRNKSGKDKISIKKETRNKHGNEQDHASTSVKNNLSTAQGTKIPSAGHIDDLNEYKWAKEKFRGLIEKYVDPDDEAPEEMAFYVRMVMGWKSLSPQNRPYSAVIYYPHVECYDQTLAFAILNDRTRLSDVLSEVFLDFRVRHCGKKEKLQKKMKLRFVGMPPAGSTRRFDDFLESSNTKLVESYTLFDGTILSCLSYIGRRAGKGYTDYILTNHRNGKSWNGNFSKSNLFITNGEFHILMPPNVVATIQSMAADFLKLFGILVELYQMDSLGKVPAYMDVLEKDVLNMSSYDINSPRFKVFQKYLSHHLAFKAPLVRASLFINVWTVIKSLMPTHQGHKRISFPKLQEWCGDMNLIFLKFRPGWFFMDVYNYGNPRNDKYLSCMLINLLELIRHTEIHLTDHTRTANGQQLLPDTILVDLMIEMTLQHHVTELFFEMMCQLDDAWFSNSWRQYEMSECSDQLQNTVSESEIEKEVHSGVGSGSNNEESAPTESLALEDGVRGR